MIVAGIDVGSKNIHLIILSNGKIRAKANTSIGLNKAQAAEQVYNNTLKQARLLSEEIEMVVATGSSAKRISFADSFIPDAAADARGTHQLMSSARTVIDVGAEEGRAIKVSPQGKVLDFAVNDRCAAGSGTFIDTISRILEVSVEEMSELALNSTRSIPLNSQCAVFGESEVISLIHQMTPKPDIARAVLDAVAGRIGSIARVVGTEDDIVLVGGVALNRGFAEALSRNMGQSVRVPDDPDFIGALGAALVAEQAAVDNIIKDPLVD
jgi:predicted CoA-substrate-specific enzyme activase